MSCQFSCFAICLFVHRVVVVVIVSVVAHFFPSNSIRFGLMFNYFLSDPSRSKSNPFNCILIVNRSDVSSTDMPNASAPSHPFGSISHMAEWARTSIKPLLSHKTHTQYIDLVVVAVIFVLYQLQRNTDDASDCPQHSRIHAYGFAPDDRTDR